MIHKGKMDKTDFEKERDRLRTDPKEIEKRYLFNKWSNSRIRIVAGGRTDLLVAYHHYRLWNRYVNGGNKLISLMNFEKLICDNFGTLVDGKLYNIVVFKSEEAREYFENAVEYEKTQAENKVQKE